MLGRLKAQLESVAGQLREELEEQMADFVWPGWFLLPKPYVLHDTDKQKEENRKEDIGTERRARERRDKALKKEKK